LSAAIHGIKYPTNSIPINILTLLFLTKNKEHFLFNSQVYKILIFIP